MPEPLHNADATEASWKASPLADLHRHLDGSLRHATLASLANRFGVELPGNLLFHGGMGLQQALASFEVTLSVLQHPDEVERIAHEICEDAAADGVTTLEIRFAPQLHRGAKPERIVDAALAGISGRAGLILCGLYGEPPSVMQNHVDMASTRRGVVGIDLAGGPNSGDDFAMADYAAAFQRAARLGIGRTVHAGEGRPPAEIAQAIELLHAQRIGHGTTLLEDNAVLDLVRRRNITIEACPTSNVHTGVIDRVSAHPIVAWLNLGVRVCVCPDNTLLSDVTSRQEHMHVSAFAGMTDALMQQLIDFGHRAAFRRDA